MAAVETCRAIQPINHRNAIDSTTKLQALPGNRGITIRCTQSRGPRGFFSMQVDRRGPVIVDVIRLIGMP